MYKMYTEPWEHQLKALDYLMLHKAAALYTDMGSGKTKVCIDLIVNKAFKFTVVVTTKKGCSVWVKEFGKHCDLEKEKICVLDLSKSSTSIKVSRLAKTFARAAKNDLKLVIIINYDSIWLRPFGDKLLKYPIDCVICDESHKIKSPSSKCSWYLKRIGKRVNNRYLVTGTPTPESPLDIYAQYRFLDPSIFGTNFDVFRNEYENVDIMATMNAGFRVLYKSKPYKNLDTLKEKMYSCAFYVTPDLKLPPQTFIDYEYEPTKELIEIYKELNKEGVYINDDGILETNNALTKALRKQQLLSGCLPLESSDFTEKFVKTVDYSRKEAFQELLSEIPSHEPVVVFAKFRHDFDMIKLACKELHRGYSEISGVKDTEAEWQAGKTSVIAVHYQSGSESIDLTKARYYIGYSGSHSYGLYSQSIKRVHRPGQERPVTYYNIVCKIPKIETVDEQISKALSLKQDLADYLVKTKEQGI